MKKAILLLIALLVISFKLSKQQYLNESVNFQASTSRRDQDPTRCENCELENGATRMVALMFAEDIQGGSLINLVNNRFDELESFHSEIFSYITMAEYSITDMSNRARQKRRLKYFLLHVRKTILEIVEKARIFHYHYYIWYEYDRRRKNILIREFMTSNHSNHSNGCLCLNHQERTILYEPFQMPDIATSDVAYQVNSDGDESTVFETAQYHVIPVTLISAFFKKWLDGPVCTSSGCLNILYGRLRRSMQKIILARLKKTNELSNVFYRIGISDSFDVHSEIYSHADSWFPGNIFLGPQSRGPFDPRFSTSFRDLAGALEVDAGPIVGEDRFAELMELYNQLSSYTLSRYEMDPFWRLSDGLSLFVMISNVLMRGSITPMNAEQWELRHMSDYELMQIISSDGMRRELKHQKFWAIKKPSNVRLIRSIGQFNVNKLRENPILEDSRYYWSKFVFNLMTISMMSRDNYESPVWLCNFTRLYTQYIFDENRSTKISATGCPGCINFDEYLFSKIYRTSDWRRCRIGLKPLSDLCLAWKNIKINLHDKINNVYDSFGKLNLNNSLESTTLNRDVETFMRWLSGKARIKPCEKKDPDLMILKQYMYRENTDSFMDEVFCFLSNPITFWTKECQKALDLN